MHVCVNNKDNFYVFMYKNWLFIKGKKINFLKTNMQFRSFEYVCILVSKKVLYQQTCMPVN